MNRSHQPASVPWQQRAILLGLPLVVGLITPSLVLLTVQMVVGRVELQTAVADILDRQFAQGNNLFLVSLVGMIPFIILAVKMDGNANSRTPRECYLLCISGLIGILGLMVPGHVAVWYPLYGPGRMSSTSVIAFLSIPFYCTGTLFVGLLVGRLITRARWFRST